MFFAAGALMAKSLPVIEGSWRYMGGSSIVFHSMKTFIFGKLVRTIEYPDGEMVSIVIRTNNLNRLKNEIIKQQPALFPGVELDFSDVKYLSRWTPPHFTEPCIKNKDLKMVPDGGVIFWSRFDSIPKRGVTLDIKDKENIKLDQAIQYVSKLGKGGVAEESLKLTEQQENALIDLLLEKDEAILALHRNFSPYPNIFKYHALRYLSHKKGLNFEQPSTKFKNDIELSQPSPPQQQQQQQQQLQQQQQTQQQTQQQQTKPIQTDSKTSTKPPSITDINATI
ncbi:hypothetical protein ACTFIY_002472 [Dictyostelium cf. discoideum]